MEFSSLKFFSTNWVIESGFCLFSVFPISTSTLSQQWDDAREGAERKKIKNIFATFLCYVELSAWRGRGGNWKSWKCHRQLVCARLLCAIIAPIQFGKFPTETLTTLTITAISQALLNSLFHRFKGENIFLPFTKMIFCVGKQKSLERLFRYFHLFSSEILRFNIDTRVVLWWYFWVSRTIFFSPSWWTSIYHLENLFTAPRYFRWEIKLAIWKEIAVLLMQFNLDGLLLILIAGNIANGEEEWWHCVGIAALGVV